MMSAKPPNRWRALTILIRSDRRNYSAIAALVVVTTAFSLGGPLLLRRIVDLAANNISSGGSNVGSADPLKVADIVWLAVGLLGIGVAVQLLMVIQVWAGTALAWRTTDQLRLRLARHTLGLGHDFHRRHTPGELIQRVDGDLADVADFIGRVVLRAWSSLVTILGAAAVSAFIDWRLGVAMLAYGLAAGTVVARQRHRSVAESSDHLRANAVMYGGIEERLTATEDLRANGAGRWAMYRFSQDAINTRLTELSREREWLKVWISAQTVAFSGTVLALIGGAIGVSQAWFSLGTSLLLFQYANLIRRPLEELIHEIEIVQKAAGAMERVSTLLDEQPLIADAGTQSPEPGPFDVTFDHVSFNYDDDQPVLDNVNLTLGAGRTLGVIGRTGGGKTTFIRLLARLVEPASGSITLSSVPLSGMSIAELRQRVAVIPQTAESFTGSAYDNLTLFDSSIGESAVEHALAMVGLERLGGPNLHTTIEPGQLSAGETQLLTLARAWVRPVDLVVLDEPTSRVDPATEAKLERAVASLFDGRTVIIVAHRLSTLARVDEIAVFEHGQIVEHGDQSDLADDVTSRFAALLALNQSQPTATSGI